MGGPFGAGPAKRPPEWPPSAPRGPAARKAEPYEVPLPESPLELNGVLRAGPGCSPIPPLSKSRDNISIGYSRALAIGNPHGRAWRAGLGTLVVCGLALVAAACGGGGSHGSANAVAHLGTTTSTAGSAVGAGPGPGRRRKIGGDLMKYSSCMRAHGVADFPNPVISAKSVGLQINPTIAGSPDFKTAQAACQHLLPVRPTAQNFTTAQQADYLKAAQCMRAHASRLPRPRLLRRWHPFPLAPGHERKLHSVRGGPGDMPKLIPNGLPYSASSEGQ